MSRSRLVSGLTFASVALFAACGGGGNSSSSSSTSSSSAAGNKAAFCQANAKLSAATQSASSPQDLPPIFKANRSTIDDFQSNAPAEIKSEADALANAAKQAADTNDGSAFANSALQTDGQKVDAFCGQGASSSSASGSAAKSGLPSGLVACSLFDLKALNSQTSLTWSVVDQSANDACVIQADNGNAVAIKLVPTDGQNDVALQSAKSACDSGTFQSQDVIDGGYTCLVSNVASAGAIFKGDNVFVAISAQTFNNATPEQVQTALLEVLKSFVAPTATSSSSSS